MAVRAYLMGERRELVMTLLKIEHHREFSALLLHPAWLTLQRQYRDEFVEKVGGRLTRIESGIMDSIEDALANGVTAYNMMGDAYHRELSVPEKLKIWQQLQDSQRTLAKIQLAKQPTPQIFDRKAKMAELEKLVVAEQPPQASNG